jgi:hypothetical protein
MRGVPALPGSRRRPLDDDGEAGRRAGAAKERLGKAGTRGLADAESGQEDGEEGEAVEVEAVTDPALARFDVSLLALEAQAQVAGWSKLANYALDF